MKTSREITEMLKAHLGFISKRFHVKQIGIFGSYVNGSSMENSDVDVLVEFSEPVGLIDFIRLEEYLEKVIGIKVDLVLKEGVKPAYRESILAQVVYV